MQLRTLCVSVLTSLRSLSGTWWLQISTFLAILILPQ